MEREFLQGVEHALYIDFGTYQRWGKLLGGLLLAKERDKGTWRRRYAAASSTSFLHQQYQMQQQRQLQQQAYPSPPQTIHDQQRRQQNSNPAISISASSVGAVVANHGEMTTGLHPSHSQPHSQSQSRADGLPIRKPHGHVWPKTSHPSLSSSYSSCVDEPHHRYQPHPNRHHHHHRITPSSSGSSSHNGGNIHKYGHGHHQRTRTRARSSSPVSSTRFAPPALHHIPIPPINPGPAPNTRLPQPQGQYEYDYPFTFSPPSHAPHVKLDHQSQRPSTSSNAMTMAADTKMEDTISASPWSAVVPSRQQQQQPGQLQQQHPAYCQQQQSNHQQCAAGTKRIAADADDNADEHNGHRRSPTSPTAPNKMPKLGENQRHHHPEQQHYGESRDPQVVGQQLAQLSLANPNSRGPSLPPITTSSLISGGGGGRMSTDTSPIDANSNSAMRSWARAGAYSNSVGNSPESSSTSGSGSAPLFVDAVSMTNVPGGTVVVPPAEPTLQRTLQAPYAHDVSKWESRRAVPQVGGFYFFAFFIDLLLIINQYEWKCSTSHSTPLRHRPLGPSNFIRQRRVLNNSPHQPLLRLMQVEQRIRT